MSAKTEKERATGEELYLKSITNHRLRSNPTNPALEKSNAKLVSEMRALEHRVRLKQLAEQPFAAEIERLKEISAELRPIAKQLAIEELERLDGMNNATGSQKPEHKKAAP